MASKYINLKMKNIDTNEDIYIRLYTNDNEWKDINEVIFKKAKIIRETENRNPQSFLGNSKYKNLSPKNKDFTINTKDTYEISGWINEEES